MAQNSAELGISFTMKDGRPAIKFQSARYALSNFFPAAFKMDVDWPTIKGEIDYSSAEKAYQAYKAEKFGDMEKLDAILNTSDPVAIKRMANNINGYEEQEWAAIKVSIMTQVLQEKFGQNEILAQKLMATGNAILMEANKWDNFWGIGLPLNDEACGDQNLWKGSNIMGKLLMELRDILRDKSIQALHSLRMAHAGQKKFVECAKEQASSSLACEDRYCAPGAIKYQKDLGSADWIVKSSKADIVRHDGQNGI
jgi:ribA/ribD-fused uncharacterized protein